MEDLVDGGAYPMETLPPTAVIATAFSPPAPPVTDDGAPPTPTTVDGAPTSPKPTSEGVEDQGKLTRVAAFPIGINSERFICALEWAGVVLAEVEDDDEDDEEEESEEEEEEDTDTQPSSKKSKKSH
ncbi:hypothetical protein Vadar_005417 [Vaccinium darrowii]|uniref:Uncharacterized protein n=1 Tax=Vaccinium darrowii TaxID=229202 RepID=A0ACB7WYB9_9ERIC|nr:hypothetical protein Vadar_005417 [Vaccinium darrowii]